jgi:hypothetical protein
MSLASLGTVISIEDRARNHTAVMRRCPHITESEEQPAFKSVKSARLRMNEVKKTFKILEEQPPGKHSH